MVEKDGTRSSKPVHPLIAKRSLRKFQLQNSLGFALRRSVAGAPSVRCGRAPSGRSWSGELALHEVHVPYRRRVEVSLAA